MRQIYAARLLFQCGGEIALGTGKGCDASPVETATRAMQARKYLILHLFLGRQISTTGQIRREA